MSKRPICSLKFKKHDLNFSIQFIYTDHRSYYSHTGSAKTPKNGCICGCICGYIYQKMDTIQISDDEVFLNEFTTFLSQLPQTYEQLRLNQFTQALDIADNMLSASERTYSLCVIFLFLFECREDEIFHEIVEKLQTIVGQYEKT